MKKLIFTTCLLLILPLLGHTQNNVISIYFDFGSSKLRDTEKHKIDSMLKVIDAVQLDSILAFGLADSVGSFKANLKLSNKRAKKTAKYLTKELPKGTNIRYRGMGERKEVNLAKTRRVDVIFYFQNTFIEEEEKDTIKNDTINAKAKTCFYHDYELLANAHLETIGSGRRQYMEIQLRPGYRTNRKHFYGTKTKKGELITHPIKWRFKTCSTGKFREKRVVCKIPLKAFKEYQIFYKYESDCLDCENDPQELANNNKRDSTIFWDEFLNSKMEYKSSFWQPKYVKVRVPADLVYPGQAYYYSLNVNSAYPNELFGWKQVWWRSKKYKYAKLPKMHYSNQTGSYFVPKILRRVGCYEINGQTRFLDSCLTDSTLVPTFINCGFKGYCIWGDPSLTLEMDLGAYYRRATYEPYIGMSLNKSFNRLRIALMLGTDKDLALYFKSRARYHFLPFQFTDIKRSAWKSALSQRNQNGYFGKFYFGGQFHGRNSLNAPPFQEVNVHLGVSTSFTKYVSRLSEFYLQAGIGKDLHEGGAQAPHFVAELGMKVKLLTIWQFNN